MRPSTIDSKIIINVLYEILMDVHSKQNTFKDENY